MWYYYDANMKPKTASNFTDAFDLLLDAYQDIGNNLPQFKKYAQLFGNKPSVRRVLVEVFEGILRFHKRAIGFFRRSGMPLPGSTLWSRAAQVIEADINWCISLETTI